MTVEIYSRSVWFDAGVDRRHQPFIRVPRHSTGYGVHPSLPANEYQHHCSHTQSICRLSKKLRVESPKGTTPSGSHRTGRETLTSSGSSYPSPFKNKKSQCTNNFGIISRQCLSQAQDRRLCRYRRLYLLRAQRPNSRSILTKNRCNGSG
jgi:hypothetical protein